MWRSIQSHFAEFLEERFISSSAGTKAPAQARTRATLVRTGLSLLRSQGNTITWEVGDGRSACVDASEGGAVPGTANYQEPAALGLKQRRQLGLGRVGCWETGDTGDTRCQYPCARLSSERA